MRVVDLCAERLQKSDGETVITAVMETDFLGGGGGGGGEAGAKPVERSLLGEKSTQQRFK